MKKKIGLKNVSLGIFAASLLTLAGCQNGAPSTPTTVASETKVQETETQGTSNRQETAGQEDDSLFGDFQSITLEGDEVSEEIFGQAKLSMVNIWGTYCGPCVREMPDLAALNDEYGGEDFRLLGLVVDAMDAGNPDAVAIVDQTGADYTHILISQTLYDGYLGQVQAVPTTVFLDSEGRQVGKVYMGAKTKVQWEAIIKELLEETAGETAGRA